MVHDYISTSVNTDVDIYVGLPVGLPAGSGYNDYQPVNHRKQ